MRTGCRHPMCLEVGAMGVGWDGEVAPWLEGLACSGLCVWPASRRAEVTWSESTMSQGEVYGANRMK